MKIERLLKILFYILNGNCVTATTLAKEFGVSRRTILRDMDTLTLAGIPIYSRLALRADILLAVTIKSMKKSLMI